MLRLNWDKPYTVNRIWLFDRPNTHADQVNADKFLENAIMKYRNSLLALLPICLVLLANTGAQTGARYRRPSKPTWPRAMNGNTNRVEFNLDYEFSVPDKTPFMRFVVLIPRTIRKRQNIFDVDYSQKPSRVFAESGNSYAEFTFVKPKKQFKLQIDVKAELFRYDLATALRSPQTRPSKDVAVKDFLKQERYIEKNDSRIQQIANAITGRDEIGTVKKIYSYVTENLEYAGLREKQLGALKALQQKKGDCSEYSDLFVALCRAKEIPARVITGYTVRFDRIPPKHHWAEVYLQKYGWVPFDPSWGDVQNAAARARAFETLSPRYIYLSHIRNDTMLHNKHFYFFTYWGKKASLKDSVKFKPLTLFPKTH